ncbi:glucosamine-6-phosphate isomerases/6-phosphogluconolactonase-domain-containing protein [Tuber indicum]|nr:glucosamine-6-phosphate isomerases/6-phosphogluconolactonase-domain-containing protein [Tuber indicum]
MTGQPSLYAFPDNSTLQKTLYDYILRAQSAALMRHQVFRIAVSGGSLPKLLASPDLLASSDIHWDKWEIFFADERAVPLTHPDSNYALLEQELLSKIPKTGPQPTVHPIDPEKLSDTQDLADAYEESLIRSFAAKDSVRLPVFDLLLLGCGPDGHTCSLFPGHVLLREQTAWVAAIEDSPKPPPKRITLTLPVVTHAHNIAFVAAGAGKKEVLRKIFDTHPEAEAGEVLPCALVNLGAGEKVSWFCDQAAVEGVSFPRKSSL